MDGKLLDVLKRYGVAVAWAGLALLVGDLLPYEEGTAIYPLPIAAVVLSAWYGGRGPGLFASLICIVGSLYWFVPPVNSFVISPDHMLPFSIFIGMCLFLTEFSAGRRRGERALRASEERFRALVEFSFDVYWETDAEHRFTSQEFSERLADAPPRGAELGKTRWEIPYVGPDEEAWRAHRVTLDAHLPFRDFELARPSADGGARYVSVSGIPAFDETGRFVGYRGVGRHITERKLAEAEHRAHLWFLESMDRINRSMHGTNDLDRMMGDVLDAALEIFASDRAWLLYPCDPEAPSWRPVMERTRAEFPGAASRSGDLPMSAESAGVARAALTSARALLRGGSHELQPSREIAEHFGVRSDMLMALHPKGDRPYLFGLHQCSGPRTWTKDEQRLFEEIGHRLNDALGGLIAFRSLRESERRLESAQGIAQVGWWERDYATGQVSLSDEACRILGVQPLELPRWHGRWVSLIHPEDRERTAAASDVALGGGPRYDVEYRVVRPDGTMRMVHSQGDVTRDESGRAIRQFGVLQDITELRQAERKLAEAQRIAKLGHWDRVWGTQDIDFSDEALAMMGLTRADVPKWQGRWYELVHPDDRERIAAAASAAEAVGRRYDVEFRVRRPDGSYLTVHSQGEVIRDAAGRPLRIFGTSQDITQLRQTERKLEAAQRLAHVGWWERDFAAGRWLTSDEVRQIFGIAGMDRVMDLAEWMKLVPSIIHPEDRRRVLEASEASLRGGPRYDIEYRIVHADGTVRVVHAQADVTLDESGRPVRQFGVAQDITELRQAEQEVRASEARFRTFVDHATDAFFLHDRQLTIVDVNRQACASLGYTREELIGMRPRQIDAGLSDSAIVQLAERVGRGETVTFETLHRRKDGSVFPVEIRARNFGQGESRFHISLARDISERKLAEEALRNKDHALQTARTELARVSRLTTLGELTASIAHEVNQPLGAMVTNAGACARWLAADPPDMEEAREALDNIVADGKRAGAVIGRIRALTRREIPRMELLDVNRKVLEVISMAEHELSSHDIVLRTELDQALPRVAGDRIQLQQVLLNLIVNAIEAMSGMRARRRELTIVSARSDAKAIVIEVRDSGPGFEEGRAEGVFEPFYTTKPQGIGIGLSISRSIVEAHGGRLWAEANQPCGAVFRFTLPVADEAAT